METVFFKIDFRIGTLEVFVGKFYMDLIGIPVRVVVGDKNLPNVEIKERAKPEPELIPSSKAASHVKTIIDAALADLNS